MNVDVGKMDMVLTEISKTCKNLKKFFLQSKFLFFDTEFSFLFCYMWCFFSDGNYSSAGISSLLTLSQLKDLQLNAGNFTLYTPSSPHEALESLVLHAETIVVISKKFFAFQNLKFIKLSRLAGLTNEHIEWICSTSPRLEHVELLGMTSYSIHL